MSEIQWIDGKAIEMGKVASIMQPTYLPWIGYFELIERSDIFVLMDDVQFVKKSWQQRNRIKNAQGIQWLTVPVLTTGRHFQKIVDVEIDASQNWAKKHLKSIRLAYSNAPFFGEFFPTLERIYSHPWTKLRDLNTAIISFMKEAMDIRTPMVSSSQLQCRESRDERIIDICKQTGADVLYDTAGAAEVINADKIRSEGIKVIFQEYVHPIYNQLHGEFVSHLSAIDLLLNEGSASYDIIRSGGKVRVRLESS